MKQNIDKIFAAIGGVLSMFVNFVGTATAGLLALMIVDILMGVTASKHVGEPITSARSSEGMKKKRGTLWLVLIGFILDWIFTRSGGIVVLGISLGEESAIFMTACAMYGVFTETISLIEKLIKLDVQVPPILVEFVKANKKKMDSYSLYTGKEPAAEGGSAPTPEEKPEKEPEKTEETGASSEEEAQGGE